MFRFGVILFLIVMSFAVGCPGPGGGGGGGTEGPRGGTTPPGTSAPPFSCAAKLAKEPADLRDYYEDAFSHYGAFLLYYQDLIAKMGASSAKEEMEKEIDDISIYAKEPDLWDGTIPPKKYFRFNLSDAITKADSDLKEPDLLKYWKGWCENPGNFLSWMILPITNVPGAKPGEPGTLLVDHLTFEGNHLGTSYKDDGVRIFKWSIGFPSNIPKLEKKAADPKSWYYEKK